MGKNVKIAYYEQELKGLNPNNTALEEVWERYPQMTEREIRSLLGSVLLTGEAVYKKVSVLSGGERAKACVRHTDVATRQRTFVG